MKESNMSRKIRLWITIGILGLVVLFIVQNIVTTQVIFLFWTLELPRAILLFLVFALGVLVGWILTSTHAATRRPG